jgi:geranylgeranyl diphosphate synthase type II
MAQTGTSLNPMKLPPFFEEDRVAVDAQLEKLLPAGSVQPPSIHTAMRYSVFAGGKRIRPILCLEATRIFDAEVSPALYPGCAIEFIHTYSLIHDDLPALDNDDYRRGKLTNHKVFGDAIAILAGDALLTMAFQVLAEIDTSPDRKVRLISELSAAAGTLGGMIGGQVADLEGEGQPPEAALLETIHRAKTGALLRTSLRLGAIVAGAAESEYEALSCYGEHIGLAFQIVDDILDVEESSVALGKTSGKDAQQHKITFPAVYGLERSHQMAEAECARAHMVLESFGERAVGLHDLADLIVHRKS